MSRFVEFMGILLAARSALCTGAGDEQAEGLMLRVLDCRAKSTPEQAAHEAGCCQRAELEGHRYLLRQAR
ncbi:hypothetical protein OFP00_33960, partial [Escherichia coli]|nr:hypothetical protein [Escherichia coli]